MKFYNESKISKKRYVPYYMLSSPINFSNKCITTCSRGFKFLQMVMKNSLLII